MLCEELSWYKAMLPDINCTAVVDGKAEFSQCHVQFIHSVIDKNLITFNKTSDAELNYGLDNQQQYLKNCQYRKPTIMYHTALTPSQKKNTATVRDTKLQS